MLPKTTTVVSPKAFDRIFSESAEIAEFETPEDEKNYEKRDARLIHLIKEATTRNFESQDAERPHIIEDWWPNHTRYIEADLSHFTLNYLSDLHDLLTEDYYDYRIQICIYRDKQDGSTYIGSVVLHEFHLLIEQALNRVLKDELKNA